MSEKWLRSSKCTSATCVEARSVGDVIHVRDSKNPGMVLEFTKAEWDAFVKGAKNGEFKL